MSTATIAGRTVIACTVQIPAWGAWYADVATDDETAHEGRVSLVVADLTLSGTVLSGGVYQGRGAWRIVAGAGGWGTEIAARGYANDAGVKRATIFADAAADAGETIADLPSGTVGPAWAREAGPASRALQLLQPRSWYIDEAGTTRVGARTVATFAGQATRMDGTDQGRGKIVLAADSIATLLPGAIVDGVTAVDVQHELSGGKLRTTIWGAGLSTTTRRLTAWRELLDQLYPEHRYRGCWEYRVVTRSGDRLNLQPARVSTGMPDLRSVRVRPGVAGCKASAALGSLVLVTFVDADPARPVVLAFDDADSPGFDPTLLELGKGATLTRIADGVPGVQGVARFGDAVVAGIFGGSITAASTKVGCG